jgi:hypothetical protein
MLMNMHAIQFKAGHKFMATSERYADYPDKFILGTVTRSIRRSLDEANEEGDDDQ